jgi:hypothetical protein
MFEGKICMYASVKKNFQFTSFVIVSILLMSCEMNSSLTDPYPKKDSDQPPVLGDTLAPTSPPVVESSGIASQDASGEIPTTYPDRNDPTLPKSYDPKRPVMLGLQLGDTYRKVTEIWGKPDTIYPVDDPDGAYTIYTYPSFTIGLDTEKKVLFITIDKKDIDPGLGGVRVQQPIDDAIRILGIPQSNTDVVVNYIAEKATLKFDIDPRNQLILSIKLFGI